MPGYMVRCKKCGEIIETSLEGLDDAEESGLKCLICGHVHQVRIEVHIDENAEMDMDMDIEKILDKIRGMLLSNRKKPPKLLDIPSSAKTTKCCSCDEVRCIRRKFDGCEQCEIKAAFTLREFEGRMAPPLIKLKPGSIIVPSDHAPSCFR